MASKEPPGGLAWIGRRSALGGAAGRPPATRGAHGLLRTLVRHLRRAFPGAALRVRVDGGFAGREWLDVLETHPVEYVVGLASNARLVRRAGRLLSRPKLFVHKSPI